MFIQGKVSQIREAPKSESLSRGLDDFKVTEKNNELHGSIVDKIILHAALMAAVVQ